MLSFERLVLSLATWVCVGGCALAYGSGGRESREISAGWRFQIDVYDIGEKERWHAPGFDRSGWAEVEVPNAWDTFEEALWGYEGVGWYALTLDGSFARRGSVQHLRFGRVNYHAKVWLNGEPIAENTNGYLPFEADVTGKLKPDAPNQLVLRVDNRPRIEWLPAAKQIEWIQYGGILQPVTLETRPEIYIQDVVVKAVPAGEGAQVRCVVEIANRSGAARPVELRVTISRRPPASRTLTVVANGGRAEVPLQMAQAETWSPESPVLHVLWAELISNGAVLDSVTVRFGVRSIEAKGRQLLLNGKALRIKGVNRYDEFQRCGPNAPRAAVVEDLKLAKRAGVNFIRTHYPQSPELLSLSDELGFLMMEELPINWWGREEWGKEGVVHNKAILGQAMPALERMIRRDKNHPSIILWSMANESKTDNETGIYVMRELIRRTKELDDTRLVTFVTDGETKKHLAFEQADVVSFNSYRGTFGDPLAYHTGELDERTRKAMANHIRRELASWPGKPMLITEYGTHGIRGMHGDVHYSEDFQAAYLEEAWKAISGEPELAGGVLWCWADYYHRREFIQYAVFGPYGVVTVDRKPKAALKALARMYGGQVQ